MICNQEFNSREELQKALDAAIVETRGKDGKTSYRLEDVDAEYLKTRLESERARGKSLENENKKLKSDYKEVKQRCDNAQIENELVEEARRLGVNEIAMRDVRRMAPQFRVNEIGLVETIDGGLFVIDALHNEIRACPHWLGTSDATTAAASIEQARAERYKTAVKTGNIREMFSNAPRTPVNRPTMNYPTKKM